MEENIDGRRKSQPSIPANYVSILQLQQQWLKEKERRQKEKEKEEEEEQKRKQQIEEEQRRREEEDRGKEEAEKQLKEAAEGMKRRKVNKKGVGRKKGASRTRWRKESSDGGKASHGEAEKSEVMAITRENGEQVVPEAKKLKEVTKKKKKSKKIRARVKEDVVGGESNAPPSDNHREYIPVKNEIRGVYRSKAAKATAEKDAPHSENVAAVPTAEIEKKVEGLKISGAERRRNTRIDRHNQRPLRRKGSKGPMNAKLVWVKKERNDGAAGGSSAVSR